MDPLEHPLLSFYRDEAPDVQGRYRREILSWDARRLEGIHDYIQWLFPLRTASNFNPDAPILDDEIVAAFQHDEKLRQALLASFQTMLRFYGFEWNEQPNRTLVRPASDAAERQRNWLSPGNHNLLRITRILTSLDTLGLPAWAAAFLLALEEIYRQNAAVIGARTIAFWREAVSRSS